MAIIYICKQCKGAGRVEKKVWFLTAKVSCRLCEGKGRRRYIQEKIVN